MYLEVLHLSWLQANCQRTLIKCREGGQGGGGRRESCIQRVEIPLVASCNKNGIGSLRVDYVVFTYDETVGKVLLLENLPP